MKQRKIIPIPGWAFLTGMVIYNEVLLHLWCQESIHFGRLLAVTLFAAGCGGVLSLLTSFIPNAKWKKGVILTISLIISVFWIAEFCIRDSYQTFMTPKLMLGGAGGVAQDYMVQVITVITANWWRILLILAPIALYGIFCQCPQDSKKARCLLAALALLGYGLGLLAVSSLTPDILRFRERYEFDATANSFGLHVALVLEQFQSSGSGQPAFVEAPVQPVLPTEVPEETEAPEATEVPAVVYGDNVMAAFDFAELAETTVDRNISALHRYVSTLTPTKKNEYTGLFAGKNLILITAEAFTSEVIDPERTPTLYRMATKGIQFTDYYQPAWGASTTSGEFSNLVGLVPVTGGMCMYEAIQQDLFLTMGHQLQNLGYSSVAYHNHLCDFYDRNKTHTHLGYDKFIAQYGGLEGVDAVWTESDKQMIDATIGDYIDSQPFSIYYMTVSGHSMYSQNENYQAKKNYHLLEDMDASEPVKCYLAAQQELEFAMEALIGYLEEAGIADDTVIVLATDHYPYGLEHSTTWKNSVNYLRELFDSDDYNQFIRDHNRLIIWSGCLEGMDLKVEEPVYSLDILPTISNLFGVEYDSRLLVGRDVFSDAQSLVLWPDYSWKTEKGTYVANTGTFLPAEGETVSQEYIDYISSLVSNKITYSRSVQSLDYFNTLSQILGRR